MIAKRSTLVNALRLAALQYDKDVEIVASVPNYGRLADSFKTQASEARKLADEIEQAATIRLED